MLTLIQRYMKSVYGKGISKSAQLRHSISSLSNRMFPVGTRFASPFKSRQIERARLRDEQYHATAYRPYQTESRKVRRQMARALAAQRWRNR